MSREFDELNLNITVCEKCPRLRRYGQEVAATKRRAFHDWVYWGRPVPNFGDPQAKVLLVGLAPAAHGGHRTGRIFTGDRSGEWLFRALHRVGFANQPHSVSLDDGLLLNRLAITAVVHCAPPDNKPLSGEIAACRPFLVSSFVRYPAEVFVALGGLAWRESFRTFRSLGWHIGPVPRFGHGLEVQLEGGRFAMASYHPSQQNTFTGRLTEAMLDQIFLRVKALI